MTHLLHAAGWLNQSRDTPERKGRHIADVRRLLKDSSAFFIGKPDFLVRRCADEDRLLILERFDGTIDGCVAFEYRDIVTFEKATGDVMQRRVLQLRLLAVREIPYRRHLARMLTLEAMLRGTIASVYENEDKPQVAGTIGIVMESNTRGLKWAARLGDSVELVSPGDGVRPLDGTVVALLEDAERTRVELGEGAPYRLAFAKRTALFEAAGLHRSGQRGVQIGDDGPFVIYDPADRFGREIDVAAQNITERLPTTLRKLAMVGRQSATVWGGPYSAGMGMWLGRFSTGEA